MVEKASRGFGWRRPLHEKPPMINLPDGRPDAHITNRSSKEHIIAAKLLMAIDAMTSEQERYWLRGKTPASDVLAVPMTEWAEINELVRKAERAPMDDEVKRLTLTIKAINLGKQYHAKTQRVHLTIQQWADILAARDGAQTNPVLVKAYGSERWNRTGRF